MRFNPEKITPPFYPIEAEIGERAIIIPAVRLDIEGDEQVLTWANTKIRTFDDDDFDHVEFVDNKDTLRGIYAEIDFIRSLKKHHYPRLHLPYVDESTYEWWVSKQMIELESEIDEL